MDVITVIVQSKPIRNALMRLDESCYQVYVHHASEACNSGKQYQRQENMLKVQTFSRGINKLMRYSIRAWWQFSFSNVVRVRSRVLFPWNIDNNKGRVYQKPCILKAQPWNRNPIAPSVEGSENPRATEANRPFTLLSLPKKIPS